MDSKSNFALKDSLLNQPGKDSGSVEMSRKPASLAKQADFPEEILDNNDRPNDTKRLLQTELNIEEKNPEATLSRATSLKKSISNGPKKKDIGDESYIDLSDLLPEGVESVEQLRRMFEEKRNHKRSNHLDWIPKVHQGDVLSLIFSPDYKFILSSSADRSIKIFDAETKQEIYQIKEAHEQSVNVIAMTSDMKYLISGSDDKSIKVFDFATRQLIHHFKDAQEGPVISLCITSDNKYIISGTQKGSVKMFDLNSKNQIHHFTNFLNEEQGDTLNSIKMTPDNKLLVIKTGLGSVIVLDLIKKIKAFGFEGDNFENVSSIAITPDSHSILAGRPDGTIRVISIASKKKTDCFYYEPEGNMRASNNEVGQIVFSSDYREIFVGFNDGSIQRMKLKTNEKKLLQGFNTKLLQLAVSKKANFLVACLPKQSLIHIIDSDPKEKSTIALQRPSGSSPSHLQIALAISPDSKYIFSAMGSASIKIINSKTKQVEKEVFKFSDAISSLAVSPDSRWIIASLYNGSVQVCDFSNHQVYHEFEAIEDRSIGQLVVSPDSRYIIAEMFNSFVILDIIEKKEVHRFEDAHTETISGLAVTPDSKYIVSSSYDKSVKLYDLATKKQIHHFQELHKGEVFAVAVSPDSKFIITAGRDHSIKILDIQSKNLVHEFVYAHDNLISALAISGDSRYIASNSADNSVRVFDIVTKQLVYSLENLHSDCGWAMAFAPNNKFIVSAALDGSLKLINFETAMKKQELITEGPIRAMAISPNQNLIALTFDDSFIVFNLKTREDVFKANENGKSLTFSSDSKLLIFGTMKGDIRVYNIESKECLYSKEIHTDPIYSMVVTPDDKFIISGSQDKSIKISDLQTGELHYHFKDIQEETIRSLKLAPDGRYLFSASTDKTIKIIDIEDKKQVYSFTAHLGWIKCIDVSSDGKFFVSCSDDRSIKIFDWKTKQLIHWFKNAHDDLINSVAISKDCRLIVSGSEDRSVKVFDIQTKQLVHTFKNIHTETIKHIAITSDDQYIISTSQDRCLKFLKLTPTEPLPQKASQGLGILTQNDQDVSDSDFYYVYDGFSNYPNFNAVDDFIFNLKIPIKSAYATAIRCQNLTIFPYKWNILHLLAIRAQHSFIKSLPGYAQFKVPFLLDAFNKTPLHYLIAHEKLNYTSVNIMLNYICDFLEHLTLHHPYQAQEIIIALTPLFWFILTKSDIKVRERFLTICSIPPPVPYNAELPDFGRPKSDIATFQPTLESIFSSVNEMYEDGEDQIDFRMNIVNLDYNVRSNDMEKTVKCLSQQKNEEVFRTNLIIDLINHLWDQTKIFLQIQFLIFSAFIIALSIYLTFEDRNLLFEIVILVCAGFFSFAEALQAVSLKQDYVKDSWNLIDIVFHSLTISYVISRMSGLEDELVRAWISTIILLFGYLRFISYLRIFKPTRSLIQVVVTVVNDMKSFIIIIALIIVGFSFIFLVFNRGNIYGFYLYNSFGSLFGPIDDSETSASEKFLIAFVAFLLNVILLNLLISIMGDSYAKVLEKRIKTDSLTRLEMISEGATFMRFFGRNKALNRGFLVICESLNSANNDDEDGAVDPWEERILALKNMLRLKEDSAHKEVMTLQQNLAETEEKRKRNEEILQEKVSLLEIKLGKIRKEQEKLIEEQEKTREEARDEQKKAREEQEKIRQEAREEQAKQNEKMNEVLALLIEMKQQQKQQQPLK